MFSFITISHSQFSLNVCGAALERNTQQTALADPAEAQAILARPRQLTADTVDDRFPMSSSLIEMVGARNV